MARNNTFHLKYSEENIVNDRKHHYAIWRKAIVRKCLS